VSDIINRYESATNGVNGMRGTAWSAFNAVTESADHAKIGTRRVGTLDDQRSRRFENVLAGNTDEMKQAAFTLATRRPNCKAHGQAPCPCNAAWHVASQLQAWKLQACFALVWSRFHDNATTPITVVK